MVCCVLICVPFVVVQVDALRGVGIRQIACGSGHTVVLTTDGEVFTWGERKQQREIEKPRVFQIHF